MKTKLILSAIVLLLSTALFAQKPGIHFAEPNYDFGTVKEEDGKVSHVFEFLNTGTSDLVLTNVQASCGCTTPQWSREPIAPKQKGSITVTYSAAGRPGPFTKTITVTSNADKQLLSIKGTVTPKGQKVEDVYPILFNDIRLKFKAVKFGDVSKGETRKEQLPIANISNKDVTVTISGLPKYITAETKTLKAGEKGNVALTIDPDKIKEWGNVKADITLTTSGEVKDKNSSKLILSTQANVYEKFTDDQIKNAPVAQLEKEVNLGKIAVGSKQSVKVAISNTGKSPLFIRSVFNEDSEIHVSAPKSVAVGKSETIKIKVDASKLAVGTYTKVVNIQLNDPNNIHKLLKVIYTVEAAKK
ncbi:MAG: DUF1573 domain-containing protein [Paludibacteraceae bacterium]|nr:DUF1573 domain-containing protein [Paludibacteraceae bacterium]